MQPGGCRIVVGRARINDVTPVLSTRPTARRTAAQNLTARETGATCHRSWPGLSQGLAKHTLRQLTVRSTITADEINLDMSD